MILDSPLFHSFFPAQTVPICISFPLACISCIVLLASFICYVGNMVASDLVLNPGGVVKLWSLVRHLNKHTTSHNLKV